MHNISLISSKRSRQFSAVLSAAQSFAAKYPSYSVAKTLRDGVPSLLSRSLSCPGTIQVASAHFFNLRGAWGFRVTPKRSQTSLIVPKLQEVVVGHSCLDWNRFKMTLSAHLNLKQGANI